MKGVLKLEFDQENDIVGQFLFEQMRSQKITVAELSEKSGVSQKDLTSLRLGAVHLFEAVSIMSDVRSVINFDDAEYQRRLLEASKRSV